MSAGTGYNIPISLSDANSFSPAENQNDGTAIFFSSPYASSSMNPDQTANPVAPATATSSAAEGNAASASGSPGASGLTTTGSGMSTTEIILLAVAGVALVVLAKHH